MISSLVFHHAILHRRLAGAGALLPRSCILLLLLFAGCGPNRKLQIPGGDAPLDSSTPVLRWSDRRMIGSVFLASSPSTSLLADKTRPGGFPGNPRRYFNDPSIAIRTANGLQQFQKRVLGQAWTIVNNLRRMDAQGAITWDIEGEQYPQSTSYVCAPDQIALLAPEMESIVLDPPYRGMKLDDAFFRIIHDAGFRVGVCVRPQRFLRQPDGSAHQQFLPAKEIPAELIRKMRYAHDRWGATLFYLDSTMNMFHGSLSPALLEQVAAAFPDSLIIPEDTDPRSYRTTAPLRNFLFHAEAGTPSLIRILYPHAFSATLINDAKADTLTSHRDQLIKCMRQGDIMILLATFWHPDNSTVMEMYREARIPLRRSSIGGLP